MQLERIVGDAKAIDPKEIEFRDALEWMARVLVKFSEAEQAIGRLSRALELESKNGPLGQLGILRQRLQLSSDRKCKLLDARIGRWTANRPIRHMLAHATAQILWDKEGTPFLVTTNLPLDLGDKSPNRLWSMEERAALLKAATSDGRSICDQVRNILDAPDQLRSLRVNPTKT